MIPAPTALDSVELCGCGAGFEQDVLAAPILLSGKMLRLRQELRLPAMDANPGKSRTVLTLESIAAPDDSSSA